jgi:DNA-binding transcriptional ArsR family regulator
MTIHIYLTPNDLAHVRFAYSPLVELAESYHILANVSPDARYRLWLDETQRALYDLHLPYLDALASAHGYIPDFLTPTPLTSDFTLEDEIARLIATPDEIIRKNVQYLVDVAGESDIRQHFLVYPHDVLYCLVEELRLYWQRALERHWPRMTTVLQDDILYRAKRLALGGLDKLIKDLNPKVKYIPGALELDKNPHKGLRLNGGESEFRLRGNGIQLVPVIFAHSVMYQVVPEWHPMLGYRPRGTGLWWKEAPTEPDPSLEIIIGAGRARVLQALMTPTSTGDLARKIGLTAGATSQHLGRLHQAGLVQPHRSGKRVYYQLTIKGEHLLALFDGEYR